MQMMVTFATSDPELVTATIALAVATVTVALLSARQIKHNLLPIMVPARPDGRKRVARFTLEKHVTIRNADTYAEFDGDGVCLAVCLRNIGSGVAVLKGFDASPNDSAEPASYDVPSLSRFASALHALYLGPGDAAYLAIFTSLDSSRTDAYEVVQETVPNGASLLLDLVYTDHSGGQLTISRLELEWATDVDRYVAKVARYWRPSKIKRWKVARLIKSAAQDPPRDELSP